MTAISVRRGQLGIVIRSQKKRTAASRATKATGEASSARKRATAKRSPTSNKKLASSKGAGLSHAESIPEHGEGMGPLIYSLVRSPSEGDKDTPATCLRALMQMWARSEGIADASHAEMY